VNGALNIVRFFAPQLQTNITGPRPYSLTPLGSTPQSLIVHDNNDSEDDIAAQMQCDITMEIPQEEPREDQYTLIGQASAASSSMQRARHRKKQFDKLYSEHQQNSSSGANKSSTNTDHGLVTNPNKVYTFEFLQHLLSFDDFSIELGSILGSVPLQHILHGQPLQIMASHQRPVPLSDILLAETSKNNNRNTTGSSPSLLQNRFWCFDIWHEMLIADAKAYEESQRSTTTTKNSSSVTSDMDGCIHNQDSAVFCQPASIP
jgi:hypothetical protein